MAEQMLGERMKRLLQQAGYRATSGRVRLLCRLAQAQRPLSIQRLAGSSRLNQANVYRALRDLAQKHIVREVNLRHGHLDYELADQRDHHHIVCTVCGRVENIKLHDDRRLHGEVLRSARGFAVIRDHAFEFFGVCKRCALPKSA